MIVTLKAREGNVYFRDYDGVRLFASVLSYDTEKTTIDEWEQCTIEEQAAYEAEQAAKQELEQEPAKED